MSVRKRTWNVQVIDGPGSAGRALESTAATSAVTLANTSHAVTLEFCINNGVWSRLDGSCSLTLQLNLAIDVIRVRRTVWEGGAVYLAVQVDALSASASGGIKKIIAVGDSKIDYGDFFGRHFTALKNISGVLIGAATLITPTGNGTIIWDLLARTLQWAAPGDTPGRPIRVTSGTYMLPSGTPGYELEVKCKAVEMTSPSATEIIASDVIEWKRTVGGFMYVADALTGHRFEILRNKGIAGISALDVAGNAIEQVIDTGAQAMVDNAGTNDLQLRGRLPADVAADRVACWDQAGAAGMHVIALLITPRWGRDAAGNTAPTNPAYTDSAKYTKILQARIVALNAMLIAEARRRPWVHICDVYSATVDMTQADGRIKDGFTVDGVHDGGGLAYESGRQIAGVLNILSPDDRVRVNVGAGSYFDPVNNPGGNLLAPGQGEFAGTNGSPGTGVSMGTGLATGVASARSGAGTVVATANKIADTKGVDCQELAISGASALGETIGVYLAPVTVASGRIAVGTTVELVVDFEVVGAGCSGIYMILIIGGHTYAVKALYLQGVVQGLRSGERGTLATEPFTLQPGTIDVSPQIFIQSQQGAVFSGRLSRAELRPVLKRLRDQ